jgi:hypothetical protein
VTAGLVLTYLCYALFSLSDSAVKALGHTPMSSFEISFFAALFAGLAAGVLGVVSLTSIPRHGAAGWMVAGRSGADPSSCSRALHIFGVAGGGRGMKYRTPHPRC